jgi:hypothetical protein
MTEEEGEIHWRLGNEFTQEYSKLVAKYLTKAPKSIRNEMMNTIQEKSNLYGSCYTDYMEE